ncbi:MAG: Sec-independent protein translocase protein TatB [Parcubacteria group bacterium]
MLPEVGATELLVIAAIALIVVGPKDLPVMLRKLGQFLGRLRAMANEFRASFEDMARQSELDELRREVEAMRSGRYYDPAGLADVEADQVFADIHAGLTGEPAAPVIEVAPEPEPEPAPKPKKPRAPRKKKPEAEA